MTSLPPISDVDDSRPIRLPRSEPAKRPLMIAVAIAWLVVFALACLLVLHGCAGAPYSVHEPPKGNTPSSRCATLAGWRTGLTVAASILGAGATSVGPIEAALPATDTTDRTGLAVGAGIAGALAGLATAGATFAGTEFGSNCATASSPAP